MPERLRLRDLPERAPGDGGWILLREDTEARELVLGLVGRFWRPVIRYADVAPDAFADFDEPGWAKTLYGLTVTPLPDGRSLLTGTMRTATTDDAARRAFTRYWTFGVGSGAHVVVRALLEQTRDAAQRGVRACPPQAHSQDSAGSRRSSAAAASARPPRRTTCSDANRPG